MKKMFLFLSLMLISFVTTAYAEPFNQIVFFGDSLTDNGTLYNYQINHSIPKEHAIPSAPYYDGRFTNGPTWAEQVGQYYEKNHSMNYSIYAVGGATAFFHNPLNDHFASPTTLTLQLWDYYKDVLFGDRSKTLFVIWIGSNDYLYDTDEELEPRTTEVVTTISQTVDTLVSQGAEHFLILNLPNLAMTPYAVQHRTESRLARLSQLHNKKLDEAIVLLKKNHPNVQISLINIENLLTDLKNSPEAFNQKYGAQITNVNDSCWEGGMLSLKNLNVLGVKKKLQQTRGLQSKWPNISLDDIASYIKNSPALSEVFSISILNEEGEKSCEHPENYIFWDHVHPTAAIHQILASITEEKINSELLSTQS